MPLLTLIINQSVITIITSKCPYFSFESMKKGWAKLSYINSNVNRRRQNFKNKLYCQLVKTTCSPLFGHIPDFKGLFIYDFIYIKACGALKILTNLNNFIFNVELICSVNGTFMDFITFSYYNVN